MRSLREGPAGKMHAVGGFLMRVVLLLLQRVGLIHVPLEVLHRLLRVAVLLLLPNVLGIPRGQLAVEGLLQVQLA